MSTLPMLRRKPLETDPCEEDRSLYLWVRPIKKWGGFLPVDPIFLILLLIGTHVFILFVVLPRTPWFWARFGTSRISIMTDAMVEAKEYAKSCERHYDERYCPHCDHFSRKPDAVYRLKHGAFLRTKE